ncbi:hypothetical protein ACU4GD_01420 [Cupriavidus basilensis]
MFQFYSSSIFAIAASPLPARYLVLLVVAQFCRRGQYQRGGLALVMLFDIVGSTGAGEQFAKALCDGCRVLADTAAATQL